MFGVLLAFTSVFACGIWVGVLVPLLWQDWTDWRRRPRDIESVNPDDAADQQSEG